VTATAAGPASTTTAAVQARAVSVQLRRARILDPLDLTVPAGTWTCIVGPNGAGKSTLLRAVAGLVRHGGEVLLAGEPLAGMPPRQRARLVGYAPQNPVVPATTVTEYVLLGRTPYHSLLAAPQARDREVVDRSMAELDLTGLADRLLSTLSGGELQRAVLARALAQQPQILLLDEPTASLDLGHAQQVLELVDRLRREHGLTVLSTLHDLALAGQYADQLVLLSGGRVVAAGPAERVLTVQTLAEHYGARAEITVRPDGIRVHPIRPDRTG
jgi:iron complex transport system ATP-binding protein